MDGWMIGYGGGEIYIGTWNWDEDVDGLEAMEDATERNDSRGPSYIWSFTYGRR